MTRDDVLFHGGGMWLALLLFAANPCGAAESNWTFEIRAADAPSELPAEMVDDGPLLNTIARLIREDLGLRLPAAVSYTAYASERAYTEALMVGGLPSERAHDLARSSIGLAWDRARIVARADLLSRLSIAQRAAVFAHELAHVWQRRFRSAEHTVPTRMWEGHAEWVAHRIVDQMGFASFEESRVRAHRLLRMTAARDQLPLLSDLHSPEAWLQRGVLPRNATYELAFLAVDWLVERYGKERLRDYLRGYSRSAPLSAADAPAPRNWRLAFPIAYEDFVAEFRTYFVDPPRDSAMPSVLP